MIEMTESQRQELHEPEPAVLDAQTHTQYILVRKELYERLRQIMEQVDPSLYEFDEIPP